MDILEEFLVYNNEVARKMIIEIKNHWLISIIILALSLSIAAFYAISQPTVYQSELTFAVRMNQPIPTKATKDDRLQEISKMAISEAVLKPISVNDINGKYDAGFLEKDYSDNNIRVQNLKTLGMFRIFAHGNSPEEARGTCLGVYEHFAAFSEQYNKFRIEGDTPSGSLLEYVYDNLKKSKDAYVKYNDEHTKNSYDIMGNFDEEKIRLYNEYRRWDSLYQDLIKDELRAKWYDSWHVSLIKSASLPEQPLPKRTGFIVCVGFIIGVFLCMIFGFIKTAKNGM